ncbi:ACT domain-containing protein [Candidatus Micrarchaeota archaeon]|nr:ACT domain-containing protein [Candidatus Micrarchaeota archaeon]
MGIIDLDVLLRDMEPSLHEGEWFMACVPEGSLMAVAAHLDCVKCIYSEEEGLTILFSKEALDGMGELSEREVVGPFALITLNVNSDLMAVGFLAKITGAIAAEGLSMNAFSAYFHDHLLVPYADRGEAMGILRELSSKKRE